MHVSEITAHERLVTYLTAADPALGAFAARSGPCDLTRGRESEPFDALVRAIVSQQLGGGVAAAIHGRLLALEGGIGTDPAALAGASSDVLRGCGLSGAKITALQGLARARLEGVVPGRTEAEGLSDEELIARLTTLRGIGRWTVEMFLMLTLGRPDIMPADDFGVREGWRLLRGHEAQLKPRDLRAVTEVFAPFRSSAAGYLWRIAGEAKRSRAAAAAAGRGSGTSGRGKRSE
ncbi:DNA-3-methyladenine glycosylase 2 family protein [Acetobacter sp. AN02]|uniref:DNA-3-methyladenine glycosylase family protein n=1 Tax=Acetobacter sp. AN02 TaxID=2894186 RepID=UPI0024343003|nr:DNA-3-methyladenine glycosylase 2 family protein [Acetobacter sp. AN02]MDG6095007.1 DNA-3-methyladenine glycosylase 2 family protein [Acetobacter sp. AN02]